ncbi:DUF4292 domain-containing protein [Mucilaginibacter daejeonensis]|uniref:DUF4292 domain-containing protein n=1 Tax=Mucilaginibacter daejeonensis TaxID=398049 RepID=UPI001D1719DF|nr:DUF4292 domain-containing protein [Mucilaginibacter daejeonensis]UEG52933.1 DUF4292 domain-containing protein [Mucilaginibacter daejeonensis]
MRKSISNKLPIILICLAVLASCKSKKKLVTRTADSVAVATKPTTTANPAAARVAAVKARQTPFNTFSGRAKTQLSIDGKNNDVTLNIRIQHGKKIWVSVTAILGIEAARALITPDSIIVINKIQGVYLKKPFSYIYNYASRQVNYLTIESLLVGNAIPELLDANSNITNGANGNATLSGNLRDLVYSLLVGPDQKVTQTSLANPAVGQSLKVTNSQFIQADEGRVIPSVINITSAVKSKTINAKLEYNRTEFNKVLEYPFSIPERFEPAN